MHPIFSSAKNLLTVVGFWMAVSILVSYVLLLQTGISLKQASIIYLPLLFFYFFFCISNYYICIRLKTHKANFFRLIITQAIASALTTLLWLSIGFLYVYFLSKGSQVNWLDIYWLSLPHIFVMGIILYCFWILVHYIFLMAEQHERIERVALEKKLLINQIELQAIKTTTHPHFLFNSLNTVANLSLVEPNKVHGICLQISEFLRYSVSYSQKSMATVNEELMHIQNYSGIERERFGERLKTVFKVDEEVRSLPILPLLLFPLVENSIKHGIDSCIEGGVLEIRIGRKNNFLEVHIENPYDELGKKRQGANIGLDSVTKRIQAYYGNVSQVLITRDIGKYIVDLRLPIYVLESSAKLHQEELPWCNE